MARSRRTAAKRNQAPSLHQTEQHSSNDALVDVPGFGVSSTSDEPDVQVRMQAAVNGTLKQVEEARPKNTQSAYTSKQNEFLAWCNKQDGLDPLTKTQVTGPKLLLFLKECVVGRPLHRQRKVKDTSSSLRVAPAKLLAALDAASRGDVTKLADAAKDGGNAEGESEDDTGTQADGADQAASVSSPVQMLSASMIRLYVAAVVDLWRAQSQRGVNTARNPREGAVSMFLRLIEQHECKRKRAEYADRGAGTDLDSYTKAQFLELSQYFFHRNSEVGLRDRLALFLSHYSILRGENMRRLELADLHHTDLSQEGPSDCFAVTMLTGQGKTNQSGKMRFSSFMRSRDAQVCPVGCLALYMFSRFHCSNESVPDFSASSEWYDLKVVRSPKSGVEPINYDTHCKAIDAAFAACKVVVTAKTHAARRSGAQFAEVGGAAASHIARAGGWNVSVMESAYLTNLPLEVLRVHAGFDKGGGGFFLRRDVEVPQSLQEAIFPWAQKWLDAVEKGQTSDGKPVEKNIAARGFLRLLLRLRPVVIQDAVALRRVVPHWYLWNNKIFASKDFLDYERMLNATLDAPDQTDDERLQAALPLIAERISAATGALQQHVDVRMQDLQCGIDAFAVEIASKQQVYFEKLNQQQLALFELQRSATRAALHILSASTSTSTSLLSATTTTTTTTSTAPTDMDTSLIGSGTGPNGHTSAAPSSDAASPAPGLLDSGSLGAHALALLPSTSSALSFGQPASGSTEKADEEDAPFGFSQDRTLVSCEDLWREYKVGINGCPSVEAMDTKWGPRWRRQDKDRKHYTRRMIIIARIQQIMTTQKVSADRAVFLVERARLTLSSPQSLDKLSKGLKEETLVVALT